MYDCLLNKGASSHAQSCFIIRDAYAEPSGARAYLESKKLHAVIHAMVSRIIESPEIFPLDYAMSKKI